MVRSVAAEAPRYRVFTMRSLAARSMARLSFTMLTVAVATGLALIGVALGLIGAGVATRVLASSLYGVESLDVPTFVGMSRQPSRLWIYGWSARAISSGPPPRACSACRTHAG